MVMVTQEQYAYSESGETKGTEDQKEERQDGKIHRTPVVVSDGEVPKRLILLKTACR